MELVLPKQPQAKCISFCRMVVEVVVAVVVVVVVLTMGVQQ